MRRPIVLAVMLILLALGSRAPESRAQSNFWMGYNPVPNFPYGPLQPTQGWASANDTRRHRVLVFGGRQWWYSRCGPCGSFQPDSEFSATVSYSLYGGVEMVQPAGPAPRESAAVAFDSLANRLWAFGGKQVQGAFESYSPPISVTSLGDLWSLDLSVEPPRWDSIATTGPGPAARSGHGAVVDPVGRRLLVFGGHDAFGADYEDLWSLPLDGPYVWTELAPTGPSPPRSVSTLGVYDPLRRRLLRLDAATLWALDLAGPLAWAATPIAGAAPGVLCGLDYDSRRDRLLAATDASALVPVITEIPLAVAPQWHVVPLVLPANWNVFLHRQPQIGYDAANDGLIAAHAGIWMDEGPAYLYWTFAGFTYTQPTIQAQLDSVTFRAGVERQWWQVIPSHPLYFALDLKRMDPLGSLSTVTSIAAPVSTGHFVFSDASAAAGTTYRYSFNSSGTTTPIVFVSTPPPPLTMTATVDSALVRGNAKVLQWTLGSDSLSMLTPGMLYRSVSGGPMLPVTTFFADSLRRFRFEDDTFPPRYSFTYELRWVNALGDTGRVGAVSLAQLIATALVPRVTAGSVRLAWQVEPADPGFTIQVQRRPDGEIEWSSLGMLPSGSGTVRSFEDSTVVPGKGYAYRLEWDDGTGTRISGEVSVRIDRAELALDGPLPNPARGSASVGYNLPRPGLATLSLFDLQGRSLATIRQAGPGEFHWALPRRALQPGIYVVRLSYEGQSITHRFALVR